MFNLAAVEAETARLLDSIGHYEAYLRRPGDGDVDAFVAAARQAREHVRARLARIELELIGLSARDRVALDDRDVDRAELGGPILVDPGTHELVVARRDGPRLTRTLELAEGERLQLVLELTQAEIIVRADPEESSGVLSSPWFWVLTVAATAAVAATVTILLVGGEPDGYVGSAGQVRL